MKLGRLPILVFALGSLALSLAATAWADSGHDSGGPTPSAVSRGVALDPLNRLEIYNRLPPDKQAFVDRENELRNQVLTPAAQRTPRLSATKTPEPVRPQGQGATPAGAGRIIHHDCDQMYRKTGLETNRWIRVDTPLGLLVCGGFTPGDRMQGRVFVRFLSSDGKVTLADGEQPNPAIFPTPDRAGPVWVTGATGSVLTLEADDGAVFYFDVDKLQYVDKPK